MLFRSMNDFELLAGLKERGVDVFVFDHHTVAERPAFPTIVNPCADGGENARKLCATAVLWSWAWKENILSRSWLQYALDLVALATVSDCMPLNPLNRSLVQRGLRLMRTNSPRSPFAGSTASRSRCSGVGAAVPMGSSRNICRESAEMIGLPKRSAMSRLRSVLPTPVGPRRTYSV